MSVADELRHFFLYLLVPWLVATVLALTIGVALDINFGEEWARLAVPIFLVLAVALPLGAMWTTRAR